MRSVAVLAGLLLVPGLALAGNQHSSAPNARVVGSAVVTAGSIENVPAPDYGGATTSNLTLDAWDAQPIDSTFTYSYATTTSGEGITQSNSEGHPWVHVPVHLPAGASISAFEFDACNTGTATFSSFLFVGHKNGTALDVIDLATIAAGAGCGLTTATLTTPLTVDNGGNYYYIEINMGGLTDGTIIFNGVRVAYKLQVSPAPATATFTDVPTTSPQFKFVEALAAAGITGGCGGGNYCPNDPLTRGQMAVFLSAALGLQWPN